MTEAPKGFREQTLAAFIEELGSSAPVPGGGSASAIAGALAAALVKMVAALSLDRPKYAPFEATIRRADGVARRAVDELLSLADEDAAAYAALATAFRMARQTKADKKARDAAMRAGAHGAALAPLKVLRACVEVLGAAEAIAGRSNLNARSDVASAASLAEGASRGAAANVLVNLALTGDERFAEATSAEVGVLLEETSRLARLVRTATADHELRDPESA